MIERVPTNYLSFHVGRNLGGTCLGPLLMVLEVTAELLARLFPFCSIRASSQCMGLLSEFSSSSCRTGNPSLIQLLPFSDGRVSFPSL